MGTINYSKTGDVIEVTIRDYSGAKVDKQTCNANDKKRWRYILRYLEDKYGVVPEIDMSEHVPFAEETEKKEEKLDWWG